MSNAMVVYERMAELQTAANAMHASGYFGDVKSQAQAMVKVMAGAEIGLPPFASMTGIHVVQGKPVIGSNLIATLVKNDPRYDYRVKQADDTACVIQWYEGGKLVGESSFTRQEAAAGNVDKSWDKDKSAWKEKATWKAFPSDMLFARAISRGARRYAPGIFGGAPIYTPDEMGVDTDEDGHIVQGEVINVTPPAPPQPRPAQPPPPANGKTAAKPATDLGPPSDEDTAISEANGDFANVAAALLGTDTMTIKRRMGELKLSVPRTGQQRIEVYHALKADMGAADDLMGDVAGQPALVTVDATRPGREYQD
jgi:hypothetical protein